MATNKDAPRGLQPVSYLSGAPWNGQVRKYVVLAADTTAVGIGDAVKISGTSSADGFYAAVQSVTATTDVIVGVAVGFEPNPANLNIDGLYRSTATTTKDRGVFVVDDPDVIFEIQADGDMADSSIGLNCPLVIDTPNTTTGRSKMELDASEVAADVNDQLKIVGLVNAPDNDPTTSNQKVLVIINNHLRKATKAGV